MSKSIKIEGIKIEADEIEYIVIKKENVEIIIDRRSSPKEEGPQPIGFHNQ